MVLDRYLLYRQEKQCRAPEAINSMYRWYANAEACYAYLSDVVWIKGKTGVSEWSRDRFKRSAWFTRGWTLQELLAPEWVIFYDSRWERIGTRRSLSAEISAVTRIGVTHLQSPRQASVAMKMSWASLRETSRKEDIAYCLMGLFDINMPLLYGEGEKAFLRLQLEIIKQSDDESIFAWTNQKNTWTNIHVLSGLLATRPSSFAESGSIRSRAYIDRPPYSMTQKGLAIHVPVTANQERLTFTLNCDRGYDLPIKVVLRKSRDTWYRYDCDMHTGLEQPNSGPENQFQRLVYVPQPDNSLTILVSPHGDDYSEIAYII